jgi:pimeloyl-ACP methyl ester carboxylesterase
MSRSLLSPWVEWTTSRLARSVDDLFCNTALNPPRVLRLRSSAESLSHAARMQGLAAIEAFYGRPEYLALESELFAQPEPVRPVHRRRRALGAAGELIDLSWPSAFEPLWSDGEPGPRQSDIRALGMDRSGQLAHKYMRAKRNQTCHARWYRHHGAGRPCAVILHGYMAGSFAVEERIWAARQLFELGLDVVISVLPFHGPRRSEARGYLPPSFPSSDPRFTIEGFRQLVFDHRALFAHLKSQGSGQIGLMGMSLGGYASALLATLEPELAFLVLFIPLASIEDFARKHGRLTGTLEQQAEQHAALRAAQWAVSPLARAPRLASERVLVIEGVSDLVTGAQHAAPLARHFGARTVSFPGGHLLHFGRAQAFEAIHALLRQQGLTRARV